ncbi:hypothetical protein DNU06_09460 [Putridiphycobacter roseus]|uniref:histidine kinase n=1 Tax=Putridiphycobacter roseus TaxID=2219161 RepID=A0A2W1NQN2_9FLAO|nr:ATP-binding protein [Putridiphycobacter roseus]PZE16968.1 hypothetical protein DNU06_09460 [Putridiphycobacter roseus]
MVSDNVFFTLIIGTSIFGILIAFIVVFIIIYQKKQQAFQFERETFKKSLLQTEIEIKEQTLSNISRELHDNLGQVASLIKINLGLIAKDLPESESDKINESVDLTKHLIHNIRSLSVSLKSENIARFGLIKMIEKDIERYKSIGGLDIDFKQSNDMTTFDPTKEIFLYRMTQEIFNNILKHAQATKVEFYIQKDKNNITFIITDDGIGFDAQQISIGSGLLNLKERCQIIGAEFNMQSKTGKGTTINIELKNEFES